MNWWVTVKDVLAAVLTKFFSASNKRPVELNFRSSGLSLMFSMKLIALSFQTLPNASIDATLTFEFLIAFDLNLG